MIPVRLLDNAPVRPYEKRSDSMAAALHTTRGLNERENRTPWLPERE
jgi:hypothetical protein